MKNVVRFMTVGAISVVLASCASKKEAPAPSPEAIASATAAPTPAPVATPAAAPAVTRVQEVSLETVYFDFDSYVITPASQEILRKQAQGLKTNPAIKIQIEGHCDERGSNEYNLALGERRARAVKDFLVGEGAPAELLILSFS